MNLRELLDRVNLPDLIALHWGAEVTRGLHRERGGVICDRRPGLEEQHPSFSVYRKDGRWRWKRFGGDCAGGSAYDFLFYLGYTAPQAREELARVAGVSLGFSTTAQRPAPVVYDPLRDARHALARCAPLNHPEIMRALNYMGHVTAQDAAGRSLRERDLYGWPGLQVGRLHRDYNAWGERMLAHAGALAFFVRGPDGKAWGLKVRNLGSADALRDCRLERYVYRIGRHGSPAWCSPKFGTGDAVLIVEGELNGAAAAHALSRAGACFDVQGLAGANGTPFLDGLKDRPVYVYADPDMPGAACVERVARIARAAGAREVRTLTPLPDGDFCDLAGQMGIHAFGAVLLDRIAGADHWQLSTTGKAALPVDNAAQYGENLHWQSGSEDQDWGGSDPSGWGMDDRGGW